MSKRTKLLNRENSEAEKNLSEESSTIQTDIVVYIRNANISEYNKEIVRRDIIQMLLDGEKRGQSPSDVIGDDYKAFCDAVISEMPQLSAKERILTSIRDVLPAICALFGIWIVFSLISSLINGEDWTHIPLTVFELIAGAVIVIAAQLIVVYITKYSFENKNTRLVVILAVILLLTVAAYLLIPNVVIMSPHIAVSAAFVILVYIILKVIDNALD